MTKLKDIFEAARARSKALDQRKEIQGRVDAINEKFSLNDARRGDNLRILRAFMQAHQEDFVSMLRVGIQSVYSKIERGETPLDNDQARKIESALNLSLGWLDRDNAAALFFSNDEFLLIQEIRNSVPEATTALIEAVKTLRNPKSI